MKFGRSLHRFDEVESTQTIAQQLAEQGASEGTVVQAGSQTAGRGRLGNSFFSPPGGLYLSVILRPLTPPAGAPVIALAGGLAVAQATHDRAGVAPMLKWPNDLLLNGRKFCGLLIDMATEGQSIRYAILGVGCNVNLSEETFPPGLRATATSLLATLGRHIPIDEFREAVVARLEEHYQRLCDGGAEPIIEAWRAWPNILGQRVRTAAGDDGVARDVDMDGALLLGLDSGQVRRIVAGEVHLVGRR